MIPACQRQGGGVRDRKWFKLNYNKDKKVPSPNNCLLTSTKAKMLLLGSTLQQIKQ